MNLEKKDKVAKVKKMEKDKSRGLINGKKWQSSKRRRNFGISKEGIGGK